MRTSNLTEQEVSGIKIISHGQTQLAQVKKVVDRARDRPGGYAEAPIFHFDGDSDDDQEDRISESESKCAE